MDDQRTALVSYLADSDTAGIFTRWKGRPGNCCTKFKPISIIGPECSLMCIRVGKIEAGVRQIKIMKWNLKISIGALCQAYFSLLPIASWSSGDNILMETRIQPGKRFPPPCSERRRGGESQARRSLRGRKGPSQQQHPAAALDHLWHLRQLSPICLLCFSQKPMFQCTMVVSPSVFLCSGSHRWSTASSTTICLLTWYLIRRKEITIQPPFCYILVSPTCVPIVGSWFDEKSLLIVGRVKK